MSEQSISGYPMISEKTWWAIRDKFKASVPSVANTVYVKSLLNLSSDASANSNVISPMKRMGLLDDDNKPTALANEWRLDNKYPEVCAEIIKNVYPASLLELFPDTVVDKSIAKNWFMGNGVGEAAAEKMVALFLLLKTGEVKEKKTSPTKKSHRTTNASKKQSTTGTSMNSTEATQPTGEGRSMSSNAQSSNQPNLHIDLQIHISPDSTPDQIEAIFASMAKHLYRVHD